MSNPVAMLNRVSWEKLVMKNRVKKNVMVVRLFNKIFQYNITPLIICAKKRKERTRSNRQVSSFPGRKEIYFINFSSLIILVPPPSLSIHHNTYRISTQMVRFRSLSKASLWLSAS